MDGAAVEAMDFDWILLGTLRMEDQGRLERINLILREGCSEMFRDRFKQDSDPSRGDAHAKVKRTPSDVHLLSTTWRLPRHSKYAYSKNDQL